MVLIGIFHQLWLEWVWLTCGDSDFFQHFSDAWLCYCAGIWKKGKHILSYAFGVVAPTWKGLLQCQGCLMHVSDSPWHCAKLISGDMGEHWGLTSGCRGWENMECGKEFNCCKGRTETSPCLWRIHLAVWGTFGGCLNLLIFSMSSVLFSFFMF